MKRRTLLTLMPLVALALALGCKPETSEMAGGTSLSGAPKTGGDRKKIKVVFIPKNTGNPYFDAIDKGMREVCEKEGADYKMAGPAQAEATSQLSYIKDEVQAGANVLCIAANSVDALNNTLDEVRAKGVKIVTIDADLTGNETHRDIGVFATDFSKFGEAILEQMGKSINYEGDVAILSATSDAPNQKLWVAQMNEAWKDPKYAKMKLVATVFGDDKNEKSATEMEGLLTKYPNLKGVIAPTTVAVAAAAKVVQQRGVYPGGANAKDGGVRVFGLGTPNGMRSFIKDGVTPEILLWDVVSFGKLGAYVSLALARGELKAEKGQTFKVGDLGERTVEDLNKVTLGPPTIFTKDNVDTFQF